MKRDPILFRFVLAEISHELDQCGPGQGASGMRLGMTDFAATSFVLLEQCT
jgi:hypothetical protein